MTHTYKLTGMTCSSCESKVKDSLQTLPNVTEVEVSKNNETATISMDKYIPLSTLQNALDKKYSIATMQYNEATKETEVEKTSWMVTYKPILLIFAYISVISVIGATRGGSFNWMTGMNIFMAGFFLTFSFFKMLNLKGFAESYAMYDIVAQKIPAWGYIYAFVELALGISYATGFNPVLTNAVTFVVMSVSIIGVLQSVLNKKKIKCACLGDVFNLPMSTITIIEDALMIVMSVVMLLKML